MMTPFRASTGAWKAFQNALDPTRERGARKRLPASWRQAVERRNGPFPAWSKPALLRLLEVPRWIYILLASVFAFGSLSLIVAVAALYSYLSQPVPIPTPKTGSATETGHIYAADGTLLADLHGSINRQSIPLSQVSMPMRQAVLAAEDSHFYTQPALDFKSIIRAGIVDFLAGRYAQGGSTITQQYVKLEYLGSQQTLTRKIQEARLAYQIERRLSKNQILDRYLNTVYFGRGAYGVQAASLAFFDKPASQLNLSESTLLAGVLTSPTAYSPDNNPSAAEVRRQYVIGRMEALGDISHQAADQARANPPVLARPPQPSTIAHADPYFVDTVRQYLFQKYGEAETLGGGLNVQTTLQPAQQAAAEATVAKALPSLSDPAAALVSIDPKTGYVTAMYGGRDFSTSQFNLATQGRRQPGSAMKAFVLVAALEKGISPLNVYDGPAKICLAGWLPTCVVTSYNNESFGAITLETATINSVNTVYAQLVMQIGPESVVKVANAMGVPGPRWLLPVIPGCRPVGSPDCAAHLIAEPSLALGSNDVSPLEMASGYATLADNGMYHSPRFVSKITTGAGTVLQSGPSPGQQVVDPSIVTAVDRVLHEVVTMGTGTAANINRPQAGKTGTASLFTNAWFVGYTPELSTAVWVGYPGSDRPLLGVEGVPQMAGGTIPAEMWGRYMKAALPPPTPEILASDAEYMGLVNAPQQTVTQTVVGTQTVTTTVLTQGAAAVCRLLPSTTAVSPLPSPVPGPTYDVYPYLVCTGGGSAYAGTQPTTPSGTVTGTVAPSPNPAPSGQPTNQPTGYPSPLPTYPVTPGPTRQPCVLGLLCG